MGPCRLVEPSSCAEWVRLPALRCQGAERDLGSDTEEELREGTVPIPACLRSQNSLGRGREEGQREREGGVEGCAAAPSFEGAAGSSAHRPVVASPSCEGEAGPTGRSLRVEGEERRRPPSALSWRGSCQQRASPRAPSDLLAAVGGGPPPLALEALAFLGAGRSAPSAVWARALAVFLPGCGASASFFFHVRLGAFFLLPCFDLTAESLANWEESLNTSAWRCLMEEAAPAPAWSRRSCGTAEPASKVPATWRPMASDLRDFSCGETAATRCSCRS